MTKFILIIAILTGILFIASNMLATTTVEVLPTTQSVEKGSTFQIRVKISTIEQISDIRIVPIVPEGFNINPIASPGVEVIQDDNQKKAEIIIDRLNAGSALTASFKVDTPGYFDSPRKRNGEFVINVFYTSQKDKLPIKESQTISLSIRYTTSIGFYLLAGLLGIIIGHIVKIGTQNRKKITATAQAEEKITKKLLVVWRTIFVSHMPALLTVLAVGFGVLLVLAKDVIPVRGWPEAIGLGIGFAILTDEQLLMKLQA